MNKKLAMALSIVFAISSILAANYLVNVNFPRGGEVNSYLAMVSLSLVSGGLALFIQSQKEKPNLESVALSVLFNFVGIGISVYVILTNQIEKA